MNGRWNSAASAAAISVDASVMDLDDWELDFSSGHAFNASHAADSYFVSGSEDDASATGGEGLHPVWAPALETMCRKTCALNPVP